MNKQTLFVGTIALIVIVGVLFLGGAPASQDSERHDTYVIANAALAEKFEDLSEKTTNSCGGGEQAVYALPEDGHLQGSCCEAMDAHSYEEQITALEEVYGEYDIIPSDPYDVPVAWARQMIEYGDATALTREQQAIYDKAMKISKEGGPCCCVCWHWHAYEGLAKHLIINERFSAEQIAEVWDFSDACGGEHAHHY